MEENTAIDDDAPALPATNLDDDDNNNLDDDDNNDDDDDDEESPAPKREHAQPQHSRRGSTLTNDALHQIRDRMGSVSASETATHTRLWRMVWPFLLGGCVGMVTLMVPLSVGTRNGHINFWMHIVVQNGMWLFLSIVNFEMVFHAAFSQLGEGGSTLPMPRAWIWTSAWFAYLLVMLAGGAADDKVHTTDPITPMVPAALVMLFYAAAARMLIVKGSNTNTNTNTKVDDDGGGGGDDDDAAAAAGGVDSNPAGTDDRGSVHRGSMIQTDMNAATFGTRGAPGDDGEQRQSLASDSGADNGPPLSLRAAVIQQYLLTVLFLVVGMGIYLTLEVFAAAFIGANHAQQKFYVFAAFCFANILIKKVYTMLGRKLDMGKRGSASLFYAAELMCALFYFSFYRLLFEAVGSYGEFFALQFIHVLSEWLTYPFMASDFWINIVDHSPEWARFFLEAVRGASKRERACYITNAFGVRIMTFIYTSIAFVVFHAFVVLGWNAEHFKNNDKSDLWKSSQFVFLAAVVECLNAWLMNAIFFAPNKLDLLVFMSSLFSHGRPYEFQAFVAVLAHILLLQLFLPFVKHDFGDSAQSGTTMMAVIIAMVSVCLVVLSGAVFKSIFESEVLDRRQQQICSNPKLASDAAAPQPSDTTAATASPFHEQSKKEEEQERGGGGG